MDAYTKINQTLSIFTIVGSAIKYLIIPPDGRIKEQILGPDLMNGEVPQLVVNGGDWKVSQLCSGEYGLISEAVAPGFEYEDNEIATPGMVCSCFRSLCRVLIDILRGLRFNTGKASLIRQ